MDFSVYNSHDLSKPGSHDLFTSEVKALLDPTWNDKVPRLIFGDESGYIFKKM
jgi:hypothetical protein